jgi:hypothetical protein
MKQVYGSHVADYYKALRRRLTTRCYGYIIGDKSDAGLEYLMTRWNGKSWFSIAGKK